MTRQLTYAAALREGLDLCLQHDSRVYVMGLGVPDAKGLFGSTLDLARVHGSARVRDMPTAENAMTGVALGSALVGMRPVLTHQRVDFALLAVEQMVNQIAKWHYMFGGQQPVPLVIRMVIGRGWGQGPQHSQSLQAWFAHVPGLKVVMPATPYDAKGLLIASVEDDNPVISLEHRWLYGVSGPVPEGVYRTPIHQARIARSGSDVTVVATSYMVLEALRAADELAQRGVSCEVIDLRTVAPLDEATLLESCRKTGRLVVADTGTTSFGVGAEVVARATERCFSDLRAAPARVGLPDCPAPSAPSLAAEYYPRSHAIVQACHRVLGLPAPAPEAAPCHPLDVPDPDFTGPF